MRIATNVNALNAWRNLSITNNSLSKTLEKLSSGYRINRAADDAAGLAISEKMRGQIAGLNMAVKNAQDGISLIQTAEGALNEVHAMLKRMEELAVQAANDTNTDDDRAKLQAEMNRLTEEITRIAETTEFNTMKLLDGTFETRSITFHIGANENQNIKFTLGDMRAERLGLAGSGAAEFAISADNTAFSGGTTSGESVALDNGTYTVKAVDQANGVYTLVDSDGSAVAISTDHGKTYQLYDDSGVLTDDALTFSDPVVKGSVGITGITKDGSGVPDYTGARAVATASVTGHGLEAGQYTVAGTAGSTYIVDEQYRTVATWDNTNGYYVSTADGSTLTLLDPGAEIATGSTITVTSDALDISSQQAADDAIKVIKDAVNAVSVQRSDLGALQNRLEHTINNLQVAAENLSAAESRIRDVDMAAEMANFTRNQILLQAGTAMLAQANAAPQSVLQLLG